MKKALALLLIPALLLFYGGVSGEPAASGIGTDLSGFSTTTLDGAEIDGSVFGEHSLTILHYFATWSYDCVAELTYMQAALEEFGDNIAVIGLLHEDNQSTPEAALALFEQLGITYPAVRLDDVLLNLVSENPYIPQSFFVSPEGIVLGEFIAAFSSYDVLKAQIQAYLPPDIHYHTVSFYDGLTNELLQSSLVIDGGSAVPPHPPAHEGYEFTHWDGVYHNVTQDENVYSRYRPLAAPPMLGDVNGDGVIDSVDTALALRMSLGLMTPVPEADYNQDGVTDLVDVAFIMRVALHLGN